MLAAYTDKNVDESDKKWDKDLVKKVTFTLHLLGHRNYF